MCDRMTLKRPDKVGLWAKEWMAWEFIEFIQRYNVAPTDRVTIGRRNEGKSELMNMRRGVKGPDGILRTNARDDSAFKFHQKRLQDLAGDLQRLHSTDGPRLRDRLEFVFCHRTGEQKMRKSGSTPE